MASAYNNVQNQRRHFSSSHPTLINGSSDFLLTASGHLELRLCMALLLPSLIPGTAFTTAQHSIVLLSGKFQHCKSVWRQACFVGLVITLFNNNYGRVSHYWHISPDDDDDGVTCHRSFRHFWSSPFLLGSFMPIFSSNTSQESDLHCQE